MISNRQNSRKKPVQKHDDLWSLAIAALLTLAFIFLSATAVGITYINWQHYTALEFQRQQQDLDSMHWQMLEQANEAADKGNYSDCLKRVLEVPSTSHSYSRSQELQKQCYQPLAEAWMANANELAASRQLKDAINEVNQIKAGSLYLQAQDAIKTWSQQIINLAEQRYQSSTDQVNEALNIVSKVPQYSPLYPESQNLYQRWQQEQQINQRSYEEAQTVLRSDPIRAIQLAGQISSHLAWKDRRDRILQAAENAKQQINQTSQEVDGLIAQDKLHLAAQKAQQLPNVAPWVDKKLAIEAEIQATGHQTDWQPAVAAIVIALLIGSFLKRIF